MGASTVVEVGVNPELKAEFIKLQKEVAEIVQAIKMAQPVIQNFMEKKAKGVRFTADQLAYVRQQAASREHIQGIILIVILMESSRLTLIAVILMGPGQGARRIVTLIGQGTEVSRTGTLMGSEQEASRTGIRMGERLLAVSQLIPDGRSQAAVHLISIDTSRYGVIPSLQMRMNFRNERTEIKCSGAGAPQTRTA